MITSVIFCLWTISCQLTLSLITPTALIALAHVQAHKARAVAHALQARAKHHRNVFHKPGFGLGDTRLIRNSRQIDLTDENLVEPDFANDDIDFDINDNGIDFSPDILQDDSDGLDERVGMARNPYYQPAQETPDMVCMVNEQAPDGNPLLIPIMYHADQMNLRHSGDEGIPQRFHIEVMNGREYEPMPNTDTLDQHMKNVQSELQRPPDSPPSNSRDANPHFFKHGFSHKYSKTISHEVVPSQADVQNQIVINPQTHTTQVVNPPVHVNVMQNQNSAAIPQQTFVQPAFTNVPVAPTTVVNHVPIIQNAQQFVNTGSHVHPGSSHSHGGGCNQCHAGLVHAHSGFGHAGAMHSGFGHGTSVSQGQSIQTHNSGWPHSQLNIAQNQNVHTLREAEDGERIRHENVVSPNFEVEPRMILEEVPLRIPPEMTPDGDDPKLGTFLTYESNGNSDPAHSQNRESVNYIEDAQKNFNNFLHTLPTQGKEQNDGSHPEMRTKKGSSEEDDKGYMHAYGEDPYYESYEEEDPMKKMLDKEKKKIEKKLRKIKKKVEKLLFKSDKKKKEYEYNYNYQNYDKYGYGKQEYQNSDKYGYKEPSYDKNDKYHKKGNNKYENKKPTNMYSYEEANSYEAPGDIPSYTIYQDNIPHNNYNNHYSNINAYPYDTKTNYYRQAQDTENSANAVKFTENDSIMDKAHEILPEEHPLVGQPMEMRDNNQDQQIENKDAGQEEGVRSLQDPLLGYIVRVPDRQDYRRTARSINTSTDPKLNKILLAEKEMINTIKKHANHDKDLMMIGYIGDSFIKDWENKHNKNRTRREIGERERRDIGDSFIKDWENKHNKNRTRREIGKDSSSIKRLFTDPTAKFDGPKTLENLGTVTKETFEHESTPLYHVRHIVGSAKDALMAALKIPNQNIITPSQYSIVSPYDERVSYISPKIFSRNDDLVDNQITNTFEKVGSVVRDSVKSSQDFLSHIGDMANHGKDAIHSFQYATPRVVLNKLPPLLQRPMDKTIIISPRILDIYDERERVGGEQDMELDNKITQIRPTRSISNSTNSTNSVDNTETVGAGLFPDILLHPFMNHHLTPKQQEKLNSTNNTKSRESDENNQRRGYIVGSINPLIFERMFNETVPIRNDTSSLHEFIHGNYNETSQDNGGGRSEEVSTSMTMKGPILEPFMGKISAETFEKFYHNYQSPPGYDDHSDDDN